MLRAFRSRLFAGATLAAFVLAQPAAGCAVLCLFAGHVELYAAAAPVTHSHATVAAAECHVAHTRTLQRDPLQSLAPMVPAERVAIALAPAFRADDALVPAPAPPHLPHTLEPPPPRLV